MRKCVCIHISNSQFVSDSNTCLTINPESACLTRRRIYDDRWGQGNSWGEICTCWLPPVGPTRFQKIYPSVGSTICLLSWRNSFLLLVKQRLLWTRFLIIGKIVHYVFAPILPRVGLVILNCCLKVAQQSLHLTRNEHFLRIQEKSWVSSKSSHDGGT